MNIVIFAHAFAPAVGGAETYVMNLAQGLANRGESLEGKSSIESFGVEVIVATSTSAGEFDDRALPFRVARRPRLRESLALIRWADVVLLTGPIFVPLALSLILRKPVAVKHHGYQATCPNGLLLEQPHKVVCPGHFMAHRYLRCLRCVSATEGTARAVTKILATFPRRWMCERVAANIAVTRHVATRVNLPRTRVVYHGVPDSDTSGGETLGDLATFAYVGRLVSEKGLLLLFKAARILKNEGFEFQVKVVGDGPERDKLQVLVCELDLSREVSFTGYLRGAALHAAMRDVASLVMPSICEETAGFSAIEHMMRGRPVIAADIGGLGEVVDGAGLKFRPGDVEDLAACMRRILEDPTLVERLGRRARARALQFFAEERMAKEYARLFHRLAARTEQRPG